MNAIQQAIEALEQGMASTGTGTLHYQCMADALTALRSIRPATKKEIMALIPNHGPHGEYASNFTEAFRAAERRLLGDWKDAQG